MFFEDCDTQDTTNGIIYQFDDIINNSIIDQEIITLNAPEKVNEGIYNSESHTLSKFLLNNCFGILNRKFSKYETKRTSILLQYIVSESESNIPLITPDETLFSSIFPYKS